MHTCRKYKHEEDLVSMAGAQALTPWPEIMMQPVCAAPESSYRLRIR